MQTCPFGSGEKRAEVWVFASWPTAPKSVPVYPTMISLRACICVAPPPAAAGKDAVMRTVGRLQRVTR